MNIRALLASPLGFLSGVSLGALGGGGSILAVPALVYGAGQTTKEAATTSLLLVGVTSGIGAITQWKLGRVRLLPGVIFGLAGVGGSLLGSKGHEQVDADVLLLAFSFVIGAMGMLLLWHFANPLTMWATFATFIGYAIIYTLLLKPATPQNIVIGGLSGAMPPALGWCAVANEMPAEAWLLVLIIFTWTPPHFWALALYRRDDYEKSGLPMLPVTHGEKFTLLHILLYTLILIAATLLPFIYRMSGYFYLISALVLGLMFIYYAVALLKNYSDELAKKTFKFSILYLALLFAALLIDHYL